MSTNKKVSSKKGKKIVKRLVFKTVDKAVLWFKKLSNKDQYSDWSK